MRQVSSRKEMMDLTQEFYNAFKVAPESLYRAPARINLIGEHIDYNGGRVLPAAISCYIKALVSKRDDTIISAYSTNGDDFAKKLREKTGLYVSGGNTFGDGRFLRINIATKKDNIIDACERLKKYIDNLN